MGGFRPPRRSADPNCYAVTVNPAVNVSVPPSVVTVTLRGGLGGARGDGDVDRNLVVAVDNQARHGDTSPAERDDRRARGA